MRSPPAIAALAFAALSMWTASLRAESAVPTPQGPPVLRPAVERGELPPVEARLPRVPAVAEMPAYKTPGHHGGTLRMVMGRAKDIRMMVVYGYARLVAFTEDLELVPDILERVEVERNRVYTMHLREGHRWSDGHPFTAEDFRYWWQDVANDKELSPVGPPTDMTVDGEPPVFEVIDRTTVRYSWPKPNPLFLPALAGARPTFIYRPAHYLKQFHERYADPDELARRVEQAGARNWAGLHARMDQPYRSDNPDLPVLQPWHNTTEPPSEHFVFERNPYYHRIDPDGRQLPYIDRVVINVADYRLVPAKTAAGESDLQARNLRLDDYTILKQAEERQNYTVRLWRSGIGSQIALHPNLNASDPIWRELLQDRRFRRAVSLAIDRHEINQVVYYGLALEGANTVLPKSPLYKPAYREAWAVFDPERANELLDEIGLTARNDRGVRLLRDGRPASLIVDTAGESTEQTDVLELIRDYWQRIGIMLYPRPSQREVFRNRVFAGESIMSVWSGLINGIPTAEMSPDELAPTSQYQLQWPQWGRYYATQGDAGTPPTLRAAKRLVALNDAWLGAESKARAAEIWHEMLRINAEEVFTIGTVAQVPQPVVVRNTLRNVPEKALYNWAPTAYFGVYRPDTFWTTEAQGEAR